MTIWTPTALRAATGGTWLRRPGADDAPIVDSLSTDTRTVKPGEAFLALRGERFDAHDFLDSAVAGSVGLLIVDRPEKVPEGLLRASGGPAILRVADTRRALGQIAAAHRKSLEGTKVIAVVGSNGKTTTTKLIDAVLKTRLRGSASPKSFNNDVGVPLTLLAARPGDQYVVCEVGSNHPGETAALGRIVQPDVVVVTSVGRDHLEFFGTIAAVAKEHAAILADLRPGGLAIVPAGEAALADYLKPVPNVITFGKDKCADLRLTAVSHAPAWHALSRACAPQHGLESPCHVMGLAFTINERWKVETPLVGEHNALNALAAAAVGKRMGLDEASIAQGLASASPADMRLNRRSIAGIDLLVDCYNSNPDSLVAALTTFAALHPDPSRRVLVLGDMLEMGAQSDAVHREAAGLIARECPARVVVLVGEAFGRVAPIVAGDMKGTEVVALPTLDEPGAARIAALVREGDAALLKGSRGVRLERVIGALERAGATTGLAPADLRSSRA